MPSLRSREPVAATAHPPAKPAPPHHTDSSASSLASTRAGRSARGGNKPPSLQQSSTPSSEASGQPTQARRSQRSLAKEAEAPTKQPAVDHAGEAVIDDDDDEDEITRCVCGHQEYPGPPDSEAFSAVDLASGDDPGSLFIQCDGCSVWQHGGCVGIVDESRSPDKYYCELCNGKLHEVRPDGRGQKYSLYRPLHPKTSHKSSVGKSKDDKTGNEREQISRASVDSVAGRRRNTLKSKQIYDEEEQLRQALEESKEGIEDAEGTRKGKRSRDDSEDVKPETKRQRTASDSLTAPSLTRTVSNGGNSEDDDDGGTTTASRAKKARAEAAQAQRQVELKEQETEKEHARAEAAGRRQQRAGRRRGDESEAAEDVGSKGASPPPSSQPPSPPTFAAPAPKKAPGKKTKRLGTNQYTKHRDAPAAPTLSPHRKKGAVAANSSSGDEPALANNTADSTRTNTSATKNSPGSAEHSATTISKVKPNGKPPPRGRAANGLHAHPAEDPRTMANMKRSLDGMMAFITRTQLEMAADGAGGAVQPPPAPVDDGAAAGGAGTSSREMMDKLTRGIREWQTQFGHLV